MAMKEKTTFQKMYEKARMLELAEGDEMKVMCAYRDGEPGVYVCVGERPIAKLLSAKEIGETKPDFKKSLKIQTCFDEMQKIDKRGRTHPRWVEDFDGLVGGGFEEAFAAAVDIVTEGGE